MTITKKPTIMKKVLLTIAGAALLAASSCGQKMQEKSGAIRVGEYEVWVLQESAGDGDTGILIDAPAEVLEKYAPEGTYPTATNAVLVRRGDRVWLVDTGYGRTIFDKMTALGIAPGDVDEVLLTHLHGDHIGGMLRDGEKAFPNAVVSLAQAEFDHWSGAGNKAALDIFAAYGDAVRKVSPVRIDSPMADGITPVAAYGHTPGHTLFMVKEGGESLLIWGDLTHAMAIQIPHPEISVRYDTDPAAARESRLEVLRHVSANNIPVVGMHIPAVTAGKIVAGASGYEFRTYPNE